MHPAPERSADFGAGVALIALDRPERHNALVPELLTRLRWRLADAAAAHARALVLTGAGASFSTGGDIAGFLAHAGDAAALRTYAGEIVGLLNAAILDLAAFPAPVIARLNGPVTGGAAGLMLAADLVAMSRAAFIQPYYAEVGFAPDGGWTALLPERIGAARALEVQYLNRRIGADEALALGLATEIAETGQALDGLVAGWCREMADKRFATLAATRALVWDAARRAELAARLEAERARFIDLVARPETIAGMERFLAGRARKPSAKGG